MIRINDDFKKENTLIDIEVKAVLKGGRKFEDEGECSEPYALIETTIYVGLTTMIQR